MLTRDVSFPVSVDQFCNYSYRVIGETIAVLNSPKEYDEARQKFVGSEFTFYDSTGKVIFCD